MSFSHALQKLIKGSAAHSVRVQIGCLARLPNPFCLIIRPAHLFKLWQYPFTQLENYRSQFFQKKDKQKPIKYA